MFRRGNSITRAWLPCRNCTLLSLAKPAVIAFGGMWVNRTGPKEHSDTARFEATRRVVKSDVRLFAVTNGPTDDNTAESLHADLRNENSWHHVKTSREGGGVDTDTITGRGANIFALDYFWLQEQYLMESRYVTRCGYGVTWLSHLIPLFFRNGGVIALLPNDKSGRILAMHEAATPSNYNIELLTEQQAMIYHPLYYGTESITNFTDGTLRGVSKTHGEDRTNASSVRDYLNTSSPFFLVYNTSVYNSAQEACEYLKQLKR